MQDREQQIQKYLGHTEVSRHPVIEGQKFNIELLAQGEYNLNFLLSALNSDRKIVLRLNMGTQIDREDQIEYEYKALRLLEGSGVTPRPYLVDDSRTHFDRGILLMEYLPGMPLDYSADLEAAAGLFAKIHQLEVDSAENHLIREIRPLSLIMDECEGLLETYFQSPLADPEIAGYLKEVKVWMRDHCQKERYYQEDPWNCIINTEVNSGNFIVNRKRSTLHLVDWEMPRWGDPSQDISHFCSPLTTLWKTNYRMDRSARKQFMADYKTGIQDTHLKDTLEERVGLRDPLVYLRGISWSAMGWVSYQTGFDGIKNDSTWSVLQKYMRIDFIRSLFDPIIRKGSARPSLPRKRESMGTTQMNSRFHGNDGNFG